MSSSSKRVRTSSLGGCDTDSDDIISSECANVNSEACGTLAEGPPSTSTSRSTFCEDFNPASSAPGHRCNVFTDDILPVILDNLQILTLAGLLNFRLVNRLWRESATKVLLKRNACSITLELCEETFSSGVHPNSHQELSSVNPNENRYEPIPPIVQYHSARPPPYVLSPDLIHLISMSPNFPANGIKFRTGCATTATKNLSSFPLNEKEHLSEKQLMQFYSLFAKTIKKISFPRSISVSSAQNLLFVQFPNLIILDLENFNQFRLPYSPYHLITFGVFQNATQVFHFPPLQEIKPISNQNLKLEKIHLGAQIVSYNKIEFIDKIVDFSPRLRAITDANMMILWMLNKKRKAQLVQSLHYDPPHGSLSSPLDQPHIADNLSLLKLRELTLNIGKLWGYSPKGYDELTRNLNTIFEGSKETLEYLELHVNPNDFRMNVSIPPLGKLKCLKLVQDNTRVSKKCERREADAELARVPIFKFENQKNPHRIPLDYFPALIKVLLHVDPPLINMDNNKLLECFAFTHPHQGVDNQINFRTSVATMSSVTTLELTTFPLVHKELGKWFPNLRNLKIKYVASCSRLSNWVWEAFPKLEKFEIYDFYPHGEMKSADGFFTGIPQVVCTKLTEINELVTGLKFSQEQIQFLRTQPYIGHCENLKEVTIKFNEKISTGFVSTLSRHFAFQEITQRTKIVFSFKSANLNVKEMEEIRKRLEPVAACIKILP